MLDAGRGSDMTIPVDIRPEVEAELARQAAEGGGVASRRAQADCFWERSKLWETGENEF